MAFAQRKKGKEGGRAGVSSRGHRPEKRRFVTIWMRDRGRRERKKGSWGLLKEKKGGKECQEKPSLCDSTEAGFRPQWTPIKGREKGKKKDFWKKGVLKKKIKKK